MNLTPELFGAKGDGFSDDTKAMQSMLDAHAGNGIPIYIPNGTYLCDTLHFIGTELTMRGASYGPDRGSRLKSIRGGDILVIDGPAYLHHAVVDGLFLDGGGFKGPGRGLVISRTAPNNVYNSQFSNLFVVGCGGDAVVATNIFSSEFYNVIAGDGGGHAFVISGGPCLTLRQCYARSAAPGHVGYWIQQGTVNMVSCNGINGGERWGRFGANKDLDGFDAYAQVSLFSPNVEGWTDCGIDVRAGSWFSLTGRSTFLPYGKKKNLLAVNWRDGSDAARSHMELATATFVGGGFSTPPMNGSPN